MTPSIQPSEPLYAFFDVDGTLLNLKSMFSFHRFWYERAVGASAGRQEYEDVSAILRAMLESGWPRETINRRYYEFFAGRSVEQVRALGRAWAEELLGGPAAVTHAAVLAELRRLQGQGCEPVLLSGSFVEIIEPLAGLLGVRHVMATRMVNDGRKYNGRIHLPQTIGAGKAQMLQQFLAEHGAGAQPCWAFGDDISDLPVLEAVGHPVAVIGDPSLAEVALARGWPCLKVGVCDPCLPAAAPQEWLSGVSA